MRKWGQVWDILQKIYEKTENKFLFVIDEWDAVFHMSFISKEEQLEYLLLRKAGGKFRVYRKDISGWYQLQQEDEKA